MGFIALCLAFYGDVWVTNVLVRVTIRKKTQISLSVIATA